MLLEEEKHERFTQSNSTRAICKITRELKGIVKQKSLKEMEYSDALANEAAKNIEIRTNRSSLTGF